MQPSADSQTGTKPPDRAPWRIIGGILGLVGAAVWVAGVFHCFLPLHPGFWVSAVFLIGALVLALFSVLLLVAGRLWTLLWAGGLLSMGLYGTLVTLATLMDLRRDESTWDTLHGVYALRSSPWQPHGLARKGRSSPHTADRSP